MILLRIAGRTTQGKAYFGKALSNLLSVKVIMSLIETCKAKYKFRLTLKVPRCFCCQQDTACAARMMQIEKQREEYYKQLGTPPGVPTMKGATADPDNTGIGYNSIITDLGDHSVPEGWIQHPKFNGKGDNTLYGFHKTTILSILIGRNSSNQIIM